jgi:hypothetical protein
LGQLLPPAKRQKNREKFPFLKNLLLSFHLLNFSHNFYPNFLQTERSHLPLALPKTQTSEK